MQCWKREEATGRRREGRVEKKRGERRQGGGEKEELKRKRGERRQGGGKKEGLRGRGEGRKRKCGGLSTELALAYPHSHGVVVIPPHFLQTFLQKVTQDNKRIESLLLHKLLYCSQTPGSVVPLIFDGRSFCPRKFGRSFESQQHTHEDTYHHSTHYHRGTGRNK